MATHTLEEGVPLRAGGYGNLSCMAAGRVMSLCGDRGPPGGVSLAVELDIEVGGNE